jgi:hypothetical protein
LPFLRIYLGIYFALVIGAIVALWRADVFAHLSSLSILVGSIVVISLGVLLALVWLWRPGASDARQA